ncbi:hypothetical protein [Vallitalea maricola]|uniref:Uncharacterized protein n=1 Tax=Vallitalea maricola TaxID=3074433 RepID=A0ACB5UPR1_9FIRM|nr:hypothetical protein AN2V17_38500 [Vallitalea sp. AN17-2]
MLSILKANKKLSECLERFCDVEILDDFQKTEDEDGYLEYNINGKTFAKEGGGGEYILLEDGSVGFWGSEGQVGRIADNINDFFEFVINCPYWQDYVKKDMYVNISVLSEFSKKNYDELVTSMKKDCIDVLKKQKYMADNLGIKLYDDVATQVLIRFYKSANREMRFYAEFTEDDGSKHSTSGTLFE